MKKMLVLHGWEANSQSNWFPWLKKIGEEKGYEVITPNLPEPEAPILSDWLLTAKHKAGSFRKGDIVIGHSMGGKAIMHFIEENNISGICCILVGPTYETIEDEVDLGDPVDIKQKLRDFHETPLNFRKLSFLENRYIVFLSDNDRFINQESARKYYEQLDKVEFKEFHKAGHFCKRDGFEEFGELLKYI